MGVDSSREVSSLRNHLTAGQRWTIVSKQPNKNIVRSADGMFADEYTFTIDKSFSMRSELQTYSYRKTQDLPLVRVIAAEITDDTARPGFCSGEVRSHGRVLTERINCVLADADQMSFPQALYCLSESLIGFRQLYSKIGPFQITDRLIGITLQGFIKVWMNQNFALNHPSVSRLSPFTTTEYLPTDNPLARFESQMIKELMRVVEYHTENGQFPNSWELEVLGSECRFVQINRAIQAYVNNNQVFVPDRISEGRIVRITKTPLSRGSVVETADQTERITQQTVPNIKLSDVQSQRSAAGPITSKARTVSSTTPFPAQTERISRAMQSRTTTPQLHSLSVRQPPRSALSTVPSVQFTHNSTNFPQRSTQPVQRPPLTLTQVSVPELIVNAPSFQEQSMMVRTFESPNNKSIVSNRTITEKNQSAELSSHIKGSSKMLASGSITFPNPQPSSFSVVSS